MIFQGKAITVEVDDQGIAELRFDLQGESVNKFDETTVTELRQAVEALQQAEGVRGLVMTSGKPGSFIVGADITEFGRVFEQPEQAIVDFLAWNNDTFNAIEDLPYPTVVCIDGHALGGGWEVSLACDYRVLSTGAKVGLPETQLGLCPGWGGTVRLPRLIGVDNAVMWIAAGKEHKPEQALQEGAADAVVAPEQLRAAGVALIEQCLAGKIDYQARRAQKTGPLQLNDIEALMAFETSKAGVAAQAGRNFPAPMQAVKAMEKAAKMSRTEALQVEGETFAKLAKTPQADALIGIFLGDQVVKKQAKGWEKKADKKVERAAVLGAGIMGGGISYQTALKGLPVIMKDINQEGIDLGLREANKLLSKRVEKGKLDARGMGEVLNRIDPALSYDGFEHVDVVVEAVVENPKVKHKVLAEAEAQVSEDTVLSSNTSTISITHLAEALKRPENFLGIHFFNPVHVMPLVEVIRGEKTSDNTVARAVSYVNRIGKKAIVIKDCPGFLVNRVLFPYFDGFSLLVRDGADFAKVDQVMEKWGWPMGPAYLADVVGIDTCVHAAEVLAEGYPDRMKHDHKSAIQLMYENDRLGQKNSKGFYDYVEDKRGKPKKTPTEDSYNLIKPHAAEPRDFDEETIIERMLVPMATELQRTLEEGIVGSPHEADMALIYGLGFPVFRGGLFRWLDSIGMDTFVAMADRHADLGKLYQPTDEMRAMAKAGKKYFS